MPTLAENTMSQFGRANNLANQSANLGFSALGGAMGGYGRAAGYRPQDVTAGQVGSTNLQPYMNPYTRNVIDTTMGEMNRQETMQGNNIQDAAQKAGAFGGDRMSVQLAENNRNFDQQRAGTLAQLNQANFGNAQNMAQGDIGNRLQADLSNQGMRAGMNQFGVGGLAGLGSGMSQFGQSQMGNLAQQGFNMGQNLEQRNMAAGTAQQQQQQQILDQIKNATQGWSGYGDTGLARYFGATQNPGGYGTQTTQTNPGILGMIGGIGSMVAPFFSDRRLKKNIESADIVNGYNTYDYNYVWESDNAPKTRGVMADEVLLLNPSAVGMHSSGFLVVDYGQL